MELLERLDLCKGEERAIYFNHQAFLPLGVEEVFCHHSEIKCYAIKLSKICNDDLVYCPEFTLFSQKNESGCEDFYIGEYINYDQNSHLWFLEFKDNGEIEVFDKLRNEVITNHFKNFLIGIKNDEYLSFEIVFEWGDTYEYKRSLE